LGGVCGIRNLVEKTKDIGKGGENLRAGIGSPVGKKTKGVKGAIPGGRKKMFPGNSKLGVPSGEKAREGTIVGGEKKGQGPALEETRNMEGTGYTSLGEFARITE